MHDCGRTRHRRRYRIDDSINRIAMLECLSLLGYSITLPDQSIQDWYTAEWLRADYNRTSHQD